MTDVARAAVNDVAIAYTLEGPREAPVVTLSHPLGATRRLWDAQAARLARRFRVLRYDTRGHGESAVPPGPYTVAFTCGDDDAAADDTLTFVGAQDVTVQANVLSTADFAPPAS